jgi:hypothetical protein
MALPLSEELERPLDEVLVELEHPAVPGVGIDDEPAVRESSIEGRHRQGKRSLGEPPRSDERPDDRPAAGAGTDPFEWLRT